MKILVIGSGGREHALVWKLSLSSLVGKIYAAPGNVGISKIAECVNIPMEDLKSLADFAEKNSIDLTVVGPELPLTLGIVDLFQERNLRIFGPSQNAALIEGSKGFAKEFMKKHHIPTASFKVFKDKEEALEFIKSSDFPLVIKADGLAAGKGVSIVEDLESAENAVQKMMVEKIYGEAGSTIIVEDFLKGEEVTIMAFTDGTTIIPMISSQDHKKVYDDDRGPNTGGMGAYAPTTMVNERLMKEIYDTVLEPTVSGLAEEGRNFKGVLYCGVIMTEIGPKVLEFNCRFGDPETQAVLPLLKSDLAEIFLSIIEDSLDLQEIEWTPNFSVCVVIASGGYPGNYEKGKEIFGLKKVETEDDVLIFHAGTKLAGNRLVTAGGRVLGITATDKGMEKALLKAYSSIDRIKFEGMQFRRDIGYKVIGGMKPREIAM
jgi:phosphoribosylamine--glycine ligase